MSEDPDLATLEELRDKIKKTEYVWEGPEDERVGEIPDEIDYSIAREELELDLSKTYEPYVEYGNPSSPHPDNFVQTAKTWKYPNEETWECVHCGEDVFEFEEDWIEENGKIYCNVNCLNEMIHG